MEGTGMGEQALRYPSHLGHLVVSALKRHRAAPVMVLGETTMTGGGTAEQVSQYAQAFEELGAGTGAAVALLSLHRPEVLLLIAAGQLQGSRRPGLHPLGSLDDHAYILGDAGITTLIIDPVPAFVDRALGLLEKVPGLTQVLTIGPVPEPLAHVGPDLPAPAAKFEPGPLKPAALPPGPVVSV